jgi:hypothetical protein
MSVIHVVRFRLRSDADEKEFLAANADFQREATSLLPGLERREACRGADGEWSLVLRYRDATSAKTQGAPSESGRRVMGFIDKATMSSALYEIISE